ncbi:mevalonate kinase [archaeon]|nr:mevalonate kinase [archaeon]
MNIRASAPGNLFFFGEYAVLYGKPSICAAVGLRTYVTLSSRTDNSIRINSSVFGVAEGQLNDNFRGFLSKNTKKVELEPILDFVSDLSLKFKFKSGFDLKIESDIPPCSGMSSSTAVFSAILKVVVAFSGANVKNEEFFDYIYPHQAKIHGGAASGVEIISSSVGGFNLIEKKDGRVVFASLGIHKFLVVIGNTRISAPTSLSVKYHIPSMDKRFPKLVKDTFDGIGKLCLDGRDAILKEDVKKIGKLMNKNQKLLFDFKVSHPKLDDCVSSAIDAGAFGAKLSGSGWGGIMFALCNVATSDSVFNAIESTGSVAVKTEIGCEGARIENKDE